MAEALHRILAGKAGDAELILTKRAGHAGVEAGRTGADCVVAVGGDGTVNEIVNGMKDTDAMLAILPMGTANVVARELGISCDPEAIADLIAGEVTRRIDVGVTGGKRFLLGAGAGLDAAIVKAVSDRRGASSSYLKWIWPTISTGFGYAYPEIRVSVDGKVVSETAHYAIVGNCRYSAGLFEATPRAKIDDGLLDVCMLHNLNPVRLAALALQIRGGRFLNRKDVTYVQGREISFAPASDDAAPLQIDGDPAGNLPADFTIDPGALRVVAPA